MVWILLWVLALVVMGSASELNKEMPRKIRLRKICVRTSDGKVKTKKVMVVFNQRNTFNNSAKVRSAPETKSAATFMELKIKMVNAEPGERKILAKEVVKVMKKVRVKNEKHTATKIARRKIKEIVKRFMMLGIKSKSSSLKGKLKKEKEKLIAKLQVFNASEVLTVVKKKAKRKIREILLIRWIMKASSKRVDLKEREANLMWKLKQLKKIVNKLRAKLRLSQKISLKKIAEVAIETMKQKAKKMLQMIEVIDHNLKVTPQRSKTMLKKMRKKLNGKLQGVIQQIQKLQPDTVSIPFDIKRQIQTVIKEIIKLNKKMAAIPSDKRADLKAQKAKFIAKLSSYPKKFVTKTINEKIKKIIQKLKEIQKASEISSNRTSTMLVLESKRQQEKIKQLKKIRKKLKVKSKLVPATLKQKTLKIVHNIIHTKKGLETAQGKTKNKLKKKVNKWMDKLKKLEKALVKPQRKNEKESPKEVKRRIKKIVKKIQKIDKKVKTAKEQFAVLLKRNKDSLFDELKSYEKEVVLKTVKRKGAKLLAKVKRILKQLKIVPTHERNALRTKLDKAVIKLNILKEIMNVLKPKAMVAVSTEKIKQISGRVVQYTGCDM